MLIKCSKCHSYYSELDEKCPFCGANEYEHDKHNRFNSKVTNEEGKKYRYITSIEKLEEYCEKDIEAFDGIYIGVLHDIFDDIKHHILLTSRIYTKAEWEMIEKDKKLYDKSQVKYPFDSSINKEDRLTIMKKYMSLFHNFDKEKDYIDAIELLKKYRKYEKYLLKYFTREELDMVYAEENPENYYECSINDDLNLNKAMVIIDKVNSINWLSFDSIHKWEDRIKGDKADNHVYLIIIIIIIFIISFSFAFMNSLYQILSPVLKDTIPAIGSYYNFKGAYYFQELDNDWYRYNYNYGNWTKDNNVPMELVVDMIEYETKRNEQVREVKLKDIQ